MRSTLLTTREAARRCGCSPDTFLKRAKRANVRPVAHQTPTHHGRAYYWRAAELAPLLAQTEPAKVIPTTRTEAHAIDRAREARRLVIRAAQLERWRAYYLAKAAAKAARQAAQRPAQRPGDA